MDRTGLVEDTNSASVATKKWGIIGIITTIITTLLCFFATYLITTKIQYEKLSSIRDTIISTIAKNIADNNIPNPGKIQMVINGISAEKGIKAKECFTIEEILDILQYKILSSEFIEKERKTMLSDTLYKIKINYTEPVFTGLEYFSDTGFIINRFKGAFDTTTIGLENILRNNTADTENILDSLQKSQNSDTLLKTSKRKKFLTFFNGGAILLSIIASILTMLATILSLGKLFKRQETREQEIEWRERKKQISEVLEDMDKESKKFSNPREVEDNKSNS